MKLGLAGELGTGEQQEKMDRDHTAEKKLGQRKKQRAG